MTPWPMCLRYPTFALLATFFGLRTHVGRARRYFSGVAADKSDEPGVLGNLPRSRPGQRSDKRGGGGRAAATGTSGGAAGAAGKASAGGSARTPATSSSGRAKPTRGTASKGKSTARGTRATKASKSAAARRARPAPKPETPRRPEPEAPRSPEPATRRSTDPLTGAVRLAGKVAEAGLRTAGDLLRRLPGR
jgi:hypothetical protein